MKKSFFNFLSDQLSTLPPVVNADLKDKTVVVVGANTGLGFEAAKHFARMSASRLILGCRSQEKGEAAIQRLKEATGYSKAELWLVDLAEFASTKAFAERAGKDLERLDILLLNAATSSRNYNATTDGWEQALQVNDLSPSLLAILLLSKLLQTSNQYKTTPRLVVVSSEVHYWAEIESKVLDSPNAFDVLGSKEYCTPNILKSRYDDSKLLNVFFVRALSDLLKNENIIVNTVNPGFCYSELLRNTTALQKLFLTGLQKVLARQTEEGSRQLVWAAVGVPGDGGADKLRGAYINLTDIHEPSDFVLGEEGKKREKKLWSDLIAILNRVDPRVHDVIANLT